MVSRISFSMFFVMILISGCTINKIWPVDHSLPYEPCLEIDYVDKMSFDLKSKRDYKKALYSEGMRTVWKYFEPHMLSEIRLELTGVPDSNIIVGSSKVGGLPDLPADMVWPSTSKSAELHFLAQINLQDIKDRNPSSKYLPESGLLYFFYADKRECFFRPAPDCFEVFYTDNKNLKRKNNRGLDEEMKFRKYPSCRLDFEEAYSLPPWNYEYIEEYANEAEDCAHGYGGFMMAYMDIRYGNLRHNDRTKIFGHADDIQGEMKEGEDEWMLLFQLSSESEALMCWNDAGFIYFWIKKSDLKRLNFDNMDIIIQGH